MKVFEVAADKITRIAPGVDPIFAAAASKRCYGEVRQILFAGSWLKRKGTHDLVLAFDTLLARHPELRLTILGAGISEASIRMDFPAPARAAVSCVQASATQQLLGFLRQPIFSSGLFEGTPLTLIEAMASGLRSSPAHVE